MTAAECAETLLATRGKPLEARAALMQELLPSVSCVVNGGETQSGGGGVLREFLVVHTDEEGEATRLAVGHSAHWPRGATKGPDGVEDDKQRGLVFGMACDPALPLCTVGGSLVTEMLRTLREEGCDELSGIARLEGLCAWMVAEEVWNKGLMSDEEAEAVEAVARGVPRKGHSVLGQGTFAAARPAFEALALDYAKQCADPDSEVLCLRDFVGGSQLAGVNWMHDTSEQAMKASGGCTAAFAFQVPADDDGSSGSRGGEEGGGTFD